MSNASSITIEGHTTDELLEMTNFDLGRLVSHGQLIELSVGSSIVRGRFRVINRNLVLELFRITGGGEGVLSTISRVATRYAIRESLNNVEWRVHAIKCANPNEKLRRVLVRRGFTIREVAGSGECYHLVTPVLNAN